MDLLNFTQREVSLNEKLPYCMGKSSCDCFEEASRYDIFYGTLESYILQSINQTEYFIHQTEIHKNKECLTEIPNSSKISAFVFRRMVHFINVTIRKFNSIITSEEKCYIDFPIKSVLVVQYLKCLSLYCSCLDSTIEIILNPNSEVNVNFLKQILQLHLDLLFIFQQFLNLKTYGYTFSMKTNAGSNNNFQLFYL